ncbi:MAG: hypothetical protein LBG16_03250, partial [Elusimicrobiota bacterium]|nr:hypothetical protein [Elusimicrobiota bacterium]
MLGGENVIQGEISGLQEGLTAGKFQGCIKACVILRKPFLRLEIFTLCKYYKPAKGKRGNIMSALEALKTVILFMSKINKRAMVVILSCFILLNIQAVSATNVATSSELYDALDTGEDEINLTANIDVAQDLDPTIPNLASDIKLTGTGYGWTLNGQGIHGGLSLSVDNVAGLTIGDRLSFENFKSSSYGAAIHSIFSSISTTDIDRTINIGDGARFISNQAVGYGGAIYNFVDGTTVTGAITNSLNIGDSVIFSGNTSGDAGGAIYNSVDGTTVTGNMTNSLNIGENVIFSYNTDSFLGGGAIYNYLSLRYGENGSSTISVGDGAQFADNQAEGNGGAIYNFVYGSNVSGDMIDILNIGENVRFSDNASGVSGGAIYNYLSLSDGENGSSTINIGNRTQFIDNQVAGSGGAIY